MKKIVVAESSPTIKSVADNLLRQNGYEVVCTSDGLQAWEVVNAERPDLVLAGLNISGINGLELCKQITGNSKVGGIPVVVMVGAKDAVTEDDLISTGARGKLNKPFSPKDLLVIVKKLIGEGEISEQASKATNYKAEVFSTTRQKTDEGSEVYNLDWTDLSDTGVKKAEIPETDSKPASQEDDQGIEIVEDQFDLASLNEADDEKPEPVAKSSDDEDYEWFIGEMQKEGAEEDSEKMSEKKIEDRKEVPARARASQEKDSTGFDDLGSSNAKLYSAQDKKIEKTNIATKPEPDEGKTEDRVLSDEEISKIADQVTQRLAASIAANIDRNKIIEAIKSSTNK